MMHANKIAFWWLRDNKNAFLKYAVDRAIGGDAFGIYGDCL